VSEARVDYAAHDVAYRTFKAAGQEGWDTAEGTRRSLAEWEHVLECECVPRTGRVLELDMWVRYINATRKYVPEADTKIAFDKFHVAGLLGKAVGSVRKQEHRELKREGDPSLAGTKYWWLRNPEQMNEKLWKGRFAALRASTLRTARAWAIKEEAMGLWHYFTRSWALKAWKRWLGWALRSRLEPVKKAARTIRNHLGGILNAVLLRATNATSESINARIQRVKRMACGFRNRVRFPRAIYSHLGGFDLYPALAIATHTHS